MTRTIITSLLFSVVFVICSSAQDNDEFKVLFKEGNAAYESGDIETAIASYELVATMQESPALYGNLGNAHYRNGNIAKAILNYERSLKLDPRNEDILFNLSFVNKLTKDKLEEVESDQLSGFLRSMSTSYAANSWANISLAFTFVFFIFLTLIFLIKKVSIKRTLFYTSVLLAILLTGSIYFAYDSKNIASTQTHAIIIDSKVDVRSEPVEQSVELFVLHEGSKVQILGTKNGWVHIQIPNGTKGWLPDHTLEKI